MLKSKKVIFTGFPANWCLFTFSCPSIRQINNCSRWKKASAAVKALCCCLLNYLLQTEHELYPNHLGDCRGAVGQAQTDITHSSEHWTKERACLSGHGKDQCVAGSPDLWQIRCAEECSLQVMCQPRTDITSSLGSLAGLESTNLEPQIVVLPG